MPEETCISASVQAAIKRCCVSAAVVSVRFQSAPLVFFSAACRMLHARADCRSGGREMPASRYSAISASTLSTPASSNARRTAVSEAPLYFATSAITSS